jgi:DNA adenine methylase
MSEINIKFLKWAGGKSQLINQFKQYFPKKIDSYIEPFLGGGSIFLYITQRYKPKNIYISDINKELIDTYKIVRDDVENLITKLKEYKLNHLSEGKNYYTKIRSLNLDNLSKLDKAARFIYLNKTCFNGLYRVNSKNEFNVPMGDYKNPDIVQEKKLKIVSKLLKTATIENISFEKIVDVAKKNDFIYFDPPYYPINGNGFTSYTKNNFLEKDQKLLKEVFKKLDKKGCLLMLSNSNTDFIKDLYKEYNINLVDANRMINCNGKDRGKIKEIIVRNYKND